MNPILVPTLAELRIEIDRVHGEAEATYYSIRDDMPAGQQEALGQKWEALADQRDQTLAAMAALPAASVADLRAKAYALALMDRITEGEVVESPSDDEAKLMRQLIAGLLDERIV